MRLSSFANRRKEARLEQGLLEKATQRLALARLQGKTGISMRDLMKKAGITQAEIDALPEVEIDCEPSPRPSRLPKR